MRYSSDYINSALMDQPISPEGPARKLLILSPPRTGSSMLCRLMLHAGIGVPHEYFNELFVRVIGDRLGLPGAHNPLDLSQESIGLYLRLLFVRRTRNGVFSTKVQIKQYLQYLTNAVGDVLFDGAATVYLTRKDLLAQAVSLHFAELTGVWSFDHAVLTRPKTTANFFDADAIDRYLSEIIAERHAWEGLFREKSLQPLRITYEELCADPPRILRNIAQLCGVALPAGALAYHDQGPYQPYPWEPGKRAVMEYWLAERRASPTPAATELFAMAA